MTEQQKLKISFLVNQRERLWIPVDLLLDDPKLFDQYHKEEEHWQAYQAGFQITVNGDLWNKTISLGNLESEMSWLTALADILRSDRWGTASAQLQEELILSLQRTQNLLTMEEKSQTNEILCPSVCVDLEAFAAQFLPEARKATEFVKLSNAWQSPQYLPGPFIADWESPLKVLEESFETFRNTKKGI